MEILTADERVLLRELDAAPQIGTTEHYSRLRWNFRRGDKAKKRLLARGLIRVERQETKNGRPKETLIRTRP